MSAYPDTSFLCAFYRWQEESSLKATAYMQQSNGALSVTAPLLFEFRQSLRLQQFIRSKDIKKGISRRDASRSLQLLEADFDSGILVVVPADWPDVWNIAERISSGHTAQRGTRAFDILHIATALHLKTREFLTFDARQAQLARSEGLLTPLEG